MDDPHKLTSHETAWLSHIQAMRLDVSRAVMNPSDETWLLSSARHHLDKARRIEADHGVVPREVDRKIKAGAAAMCAPSSGAW